MFNFLIGADTAGGINSWVVWVILGAVLLVLIVLPMFTRKRQSNQVNEMINSIKVGDKIKTVGGIIGNVVKIDQISPVDKEFVIETGDENKTQIRIDVQAVYQVVSKIATPHEEVMSGSAEQAAVVDGATAEVATEDAVADAPVEQAQAEEASAEQDAPEAEQSAEGGSEDAYVYKPVSKKGKQSK